MKTLSRILIVALFVTGLATAARGEEQGILYDEYVIPEGTELRLELHTAVDSGDSSKEQEVTATLFDPVYVYEREVLERGVYVFGSVEEVEPAGHKGRRGSLTLRFHTIEPPHGEQIPISGSLMDVYMSEHYEDVRVDVEGRLIGEGASGWLRAAILAGAVAGGVPAGALAAVGAGVGGLFGAVWLPRGSDARLEAGSMIGVRLDQYAIVRIPVDDEEPF
jgi:hypothetical protein